MADPSQWNPPLTTLPIWQGTPPGFNPAFGQPVPTLTPYLSPGDGFCGAIVVLPGGGYGGKAPHEAEPIALWLNSLGISAFVLDYRVAPYRNPIPLVDARRAIQFVRSRAVEWSVDPQRVGILGFSAGGHLASTTGTHFESFPGPEDPVSQYSSRPDAMVLCYPVISFGKFAHLGSMENLLGPNPPGDVREAFSNEKQVSTHTPPTFLWHTADDASVPVENSLLFAQALSACRVPFELHIYPSGQHGLGLATEYPHVGTWTKTCAGWLDTLGFTKR
jgi:acetyl esterase/lipase